MDASKYNTVAAGNQRAVCKLNFLVPWFCVTSYQREMQ